MSSPPVFSRVDHLVIAVRDLATAEREYSALLGRRPSARGAHPDLGTENVIFGLANCYLELLALGPTPSTHPVASAIANYLSRHAEGLFAIALGSEDLAHTARALRSAGLTVGEATTLQVVEADGRRRRAELLPIAREHSRGVNVVAIAHDRAAIAVSAATAAEATTATAVDHVVIFSDDIEAALALWRDTFGIPERWRREFSERGTVNIGLRLGGVTLELVAPLGNAAGERGERLWGLAYAVGDCDGAVERLRAAGIAASEARSGLAPATRVATVKRPEGVPTLVIQHANR